MGIPSKRSNLHPKFAHTCHGKDCDDGDSTADIHKPEVISSEAENVLMMSVITVVEIILLIADEHGEQENDAKGNCQLKEKQLMVNN